jgi:hypothetical protein
LRSRSEPGARHECLALPRQRCHRSVTPAPRA